MSRPEIRCEELPDFRMNSNEDLVANLRINIIRNRAIQVSGCSGNITRRRYS
jgi:hypothetical protein